MHSAISNWDSRSWSASTIRGMRPGKRAFWISGWDLPSISVFRRCSSGWRSTGAFALLGGGHAVHARQLPALRQYRHARQRRRTYRSGRAGRTRRQVESRHLFARHSRPADLHSGETPSDHGRRLFQTSSWAPTRFIRNRRRKTACPGSGPISSGSVSVSAIAVSVLHPLRRDSAVQTACGTRLPCLLVRCRTHALIAT